MPFAAAFKAAELARFKFSQMHMGVAVRITLFAADRASAEEAAKLAFARFALLDDMMSDYQRASELNGVCRSAVSGPVEVSPELFEVLSVAKHVSVLSQGAFDMTSAPVVGLWREARKSGRLPRKVDLASALDLVGPSRVHLGTERRTVKLEPGTLLDLGGIAKGYACDEAVRTLTEAGIESALVKAGGDIAVSGSPPGEAGWSVAVQGLAAPPLTLAHQAVSTSGEAEQYVEIGRARYSHIVDPRTGMALSNHGQVTVIGRRGLWTDPIASALSVHPDLDLSLLNDPLDLVVIHGPRL